MHRAILAAATAAVSILAAGCVQDSAEATNKRMSTSKVYIGALTCDIAGGRGYRRRQPRSEVQLRAGKGRARSLQRDDPQSRSRPRRNPADDAGVEGVFARYPAEARRT